MMLSARNHFNRSLETRLWLILLIALLSVQSLPLHSGDMNSPARVVDLYFEAEMRSDLELLDRVLAPGFMEISPIGAIDNRERVLSFYARDDVRENFDLSFGSKMIQLRDGIAVVAVDVLIERAGQRLHRVTVGLTLQRNADNEWKLLSAQYTPVR